jgi:capsular exopolysaccharide synthesis family protein
MGRIADALRKAEEERQLAMDAARDGGGVAVKATDSTLEPSAHAADLAELPASDGDARQPLAVVEGLSESLVPFYEPSSLVTEQYRSLRTRLLSQNPQYDHRIMAITSAVPKEGKSVTTLNLGTILAEIRHLKVLIVDGDFRRSSLAQMLNQRSGPGLADVLSGQASYDDVIQPTPIPNMMFMPAGTTQRSSAAKLLTEPVAKTCFKRMQNEFHYTIVDTPPATTVTDVGIIGQMCSGVIVLVRLHRTHEIAAKRAVRLLQVNNIHIIGCMIVGRDAPVDRYGYGYGHHYNYYRYYHYYNYGGGDGKKK